MNETIKLGLILFLITALSGGILAFSNEVTSVRIEEAERLADQIAKQETLPNGKIFEEIDEGLAETIIVDNPDIIEIFEGYDDDELVGYTFKMNANGYGGDIEFTVGISTEGKIMGIKILNHKETPGLGANATKPEFTESFRNKPVDQEVVSAREPAGDDEVQAITSATTTTEAIVSGVNVARQIYNETLSEQSN
ncbi:MAG: RnfABCDGE type electron transport complex subunit G [Tissierellia bacterium]|nr:RnfABCDGE type electron transport complex subunit G [Tissierellia bacterium]